MSKKKIVPKKKMNQRKKKVQAKETTVPPRPVVEEPNDYKLKDPLGVEDEPDPYPLNSDGDHIEPEDLLDIDGPSNSDDLVPLSPKMKAAKEDYEFFYRQFPTLTNPVEIDHVDKFRFTRLIGWYRYEQMRLAMLEGYDWAK